MTKRIFRSIFLVALVVLLLSVALLSVVFYNDYAVQYRSELKSEALSMAHAINGGLAEENYLRSLEQDKISQIRITWIGADGTVRYDNEAAPAQMENHAARTEVADALRYGAGESERYSATLSRKTFYYACRLQDGTVLRLAGTRDSVLGILLRMLRPAVAAVLVAIALAWLLHQKAVTSVIIGAKRVEQLDDNIAATGIRLSEDELKQLDAVSALPREYPGWMLERQGEYRRNQLAQQ